MTRTEYLTTRKQRQEEKIQFVKENYEKYYTYELAEKLNVSVTAIRNICEILGVQPRYEYVSRKKDYTLIDEFIMDNQGMTIEKISQKLNIKPYLVNLRRRELGLTYKAESKVVENESEFFNVDKMAWVI